MKKTITSGLFLSLFSVCITAQNGTININSIHFNKDTEKKMILINQDIEVINTQYPDNKESILSDGSVYTFTSPLSELEIGKAYQVTDANSESYKLYFTQLPIINISTNNTIVDEPRVYANFTLCESNGDLIGNAIGIEYRGGFTQSLPKKSLRIEFWADAVGDDTENIELLGMRSDDDWNIQAMYNEPLRIRSKSNFELWNQMDELYYLDKEPEAINGVRQAYVELFINDEYSGVYALSERVDRKQLKLKKYKDEEIRGELYKGVGWGDATTFLSAPSYDNNSNFWSGFEYEHPDEETDWGNIYDFVDFVVNEDSSNFYENYSSQFDVDNAVNYFIFLNLIRAVDNRGKNLYIAKYNTEEAYFYVPWDLDGTFGMSWNGNKDNYANGLLSNGFYERLLLDQADSGFADKLKKKWNEWRTDLITIDNLIGNLRTQFDYLKTNGVYERELIAWKDAGDFLDLDNLQYTSDWLVKRLEFLDYAFNNLNLFTKVEEFTRIDQVGIKVSPNPASNYVNIEVSNTNLTIRNISLFNATGQLLMRFGAENTTDIDVSFLNNGLYYVAVEFENGIRQLKKMVINR